MSALSPDLALAWLGELTVGLRAAVVVGAGGEALAGDAALALPAARLLALAPSATVVLPDALVVAAGSDRHGVAVVAPASSLAGLLAHDVRCVLADLGGRVPDPTGDPQPSTAVVTAAREVAAAAG